MPARGTRTPAHPDGRRERVPAVMGGCDRGPVPHSPWRGRAPGSSGGATSGTWPEDLVPLGGRVVEGLLDRLLGLHGVLDLRGQDLVELDGLRHAESSGSWRWAGASAGRRPGQSLFSLKNGFSGHVLPGREVPGPSRPQLVALGAGQPPGELPRRFLVLGLRGHRVERASHDGARWSRPSAGSRCRTGGSGSSSSGSGCPTAPRTSCRCCRRRSCRASRARRSDSTPGTTTLWTLTRSTYHWTAFTPAGLLKTALLLFSSMTSPPAW